MEVLKEKNSKIYKFHGAIGLFRVNRDEKSAVLGVWEEKIGSSRDYHLQGRWFEMNMDSIRVPDNCGY